MTNWSNWQKLAKLGKMVKKLKIQNRQNGLIDQNKKRAEKHKMEGMVNLIKMPKKFQ